jgi:hypothetical protein
MNGSWELPFYLLGSRFGERGRSPTTPAMAATSAPFVAKKGEDTGARVPHSSDREARARHLTLVGGPHRAATQ